MLTQLTPASHSSTSCRCGSTWGTQIKSNSQSMLEGEKKKMRVKDLCFRGISHTTSCISDGRLALDCVNKNQLCKKSLKIKKLYHIVWISFYYGANFCNGDRSDRQLGSANITKGNLNRGRERYFRVEVAVAWHCWNFFGKKLSTCIRFWPNPDNWQPIV